MGKLTGPWCVARPRFPRLARSEARRPSPHRPWLTHNRGWTLLLTAAALLSAPAAARNPETAADPRQGSWIAVEDKLIHHARDRWSVFAAPGTVNGMAVEGQTVWVGTDEGVVRFESQSRHRTQITMDEGLPSQRVRAVVTDEDYVWFGTNKGLARYRKLDRAMRIYTDEDGLPHRAVNDLVRMGRQIWIATRAGLAVYDPNVDGLRAYTVQDGLGSDFVQELYAVSDDLWCITDAGLSRFEPGTRRFTNYPATEVGGDEIRAFSPVGDRIWVGTEAGISIFDRRSNAFIGFPDQNALPNRAIRGLEPNGHYLFIITEKQVSRYSTYTQSFRHFIEADGITRPAGATGTLLSDGHLLVMHPDGAEIYDIAHDLWVRRTLEPTEPSGDGAGRVSSHGWIELETDVPVDVARRLSRSRATDQAYGTVQGGVGAGYRLEEGRSLDLSVLLDYGEVEAEGIRDFQLEGEYRGRSEDLVREIRLDDALKADTLEEGVERALLLSGGRVRLASPGDEPRLEATVDAGARRGVTAREFFTGPGQGLVSLAHKYVLPGSERVYLDGELLQSGEDYTLVYSDGQLAFLDPERVDDLSVIEVEYEYDVVAKKGLGVISIFDYLPADNEIGSWSLAGEPTYISEESGLYNQIDGAAPKYIDRGWRRSVYAEYQQGGSTIRVAIHDMGSEQQARQIYDYDLPTSREAVGDHDSLVLDIGLASAYAVKALAGVYYVELSIDEKSELARQSVKLFGVQVVDRGSRAGEHRVDEPMRTLAATRVAVSPMRGLQIGTRAMHLGTARTASRGGARQDQLNGILDARYERKLPRGGRLTGYGEVVGSHDRLQAGNAGLAGMGMVRVSHPWLEGAASGRFMSRGYQPLGSKSTLHGTLAQQSRLDATAYPRRWLPTSVFVSRERSYLADGSGRATVQHALARMRLTHKKGPTSSLQIGHSLLDDGVGTVTHRLKLAGQADYDFAQGILAPIGMRRFILRGLFSVSDAATESLGQLTQADRVFVSRLEASLAPTATETAFARLRSRSARRSAARGEKLALVARFWELEAGARSESVAGLVPEVTYLAGYDDDRTGEPSDGEPRRSRDAEGSVTGQLGIYPGAWLAALTPVAAQLSYSVGEASLAEDGVRQHHARIRELRNRMGYNGMDKLQVDLSEKVRTLHVGAEQSEQSRLVELRNAVIYRPSHASPVRLRIDRIALRQRNDLAAEPEAPPFGEEVTYETAIEWTMRWSRRWTTKLEALYRHQAVQGMVEAGTAESLDGEPSSSGRLGMESAYSGVADYTLHAVEPRLQVRYLLQQEQGALYLNPWIRSRLSEANGAGADSEARVEVGLTVVWMLGDAVHLDATVTYTHLWYTETQRPSRRSLAPFVLLTVKL